MIQACTYYFYWLYVIALKCLQQANNLGVAQIRMVLFAAEVQYKHRGTSDHPTLSGQLKH